jgi:hypothetical protein
MNLKEEFEAKRRKNLEGIKRAMSKKKNDPDTKQMLKFARQAIKTGDNKLVLENQDTNITNI